MAALIRWGRVVVVQALQCNMTLLIELDTAGLAALGSLQPLTWQPQAPPHSGSQEGTRPTAGMHELCHTYSTTHSEYVVECD